MSSYPRRMEPNEFVEKLLEEVSLETLEYATDVERLMAEQIAFLRAQIEVCRKEAVSGAHAVIRELYGRLADKDTQIETLRQQLRFLQGQIAPRAS